MTYPMLEHMRSEGQERVLVADDRLNEVIDAYLARYEVTVEGGTFRPGPAVLKVVEDAIHGLLAEPEFERAFHEMIMSLGMLRGLPSRKPS